MFASFIDKVITQMQFNIVKSNVIYLLIQTFFFVKQKVNKTSLESWMRYLTSQPRASQFLSQTQNPVVSALSDAIGRYLPDLAVSHYSPDKRDPEFVTYTPTSAPLNIYNVKPAIFDLILTFIIAMYLGIVYIFIFKFSSIYSQMCKISFSSAVKSFKVQ